jgi:hypothetical protein
VTTSGRTLRVANRIVMRLHDDRTVASRDYHNTLHGRSVGALAEALGA